jgi:hypothetical protein
MKTNIFTIIFVVLGITFFNFPAWGTDVGGQILTDTTWDFGRSPYNITSEVQIDEGVTLTIEPGVAVMNGSIKVWGTLNAIGTKNSKIKFNNTWIGPPQATSNAVITIQHAELSRGRLFCEYGFTLVLTDSIVNGLPGLHDFWLQIKLPYNDCIVERNIFLNLGPFQTESRGNTIITIRNNLFIDARLHNGPTNDNSVSPHHFIISLN